MTLKPVKLHKVAAKVAHKRAFHHVHCVAEMAVVATAAAADGHLSLVATSAALIVVLFVQLCAGE